MSNWKEIKNYPNYEVSDMGDVRNKKTGRILKHLVNSCGYHQVYLGYKKDEEGNVIFIDGKRVQYLPIVSRLVAEAFIPNPNNEPEVNHINENKDDNSLPNLEWVDRDKNISHGTRTQRQRNYAKNMTVSHKSNLSISASNRGHNNDGPRPVRLTKGDEILEFKTVRAAGRFLNVNFSKVHYSVDHNKKIDGYTIEKLPLDYEVKN